jgi:glycosyltransferase involved in cell wall biosynthesis
LRDKIERWLERKCITNAERVTVASPGIGNALLHRVPSVNGKLEVVLNGYDFRATPSERPSGRLRLLYAGSLYLNRNPFPLLEALRDLLRLPTVDRARLSFILVGRCESWNGRDVTAWIEAAGMQDVVQVLPSVPPATVLKLMEQTEVMVNFAQGQPEQIPAKLYDYIASGREMLLIAERDSDAARITRESGAGRVVEPEDKAALYTNLQELYTYYVERGLPYIPNEERVRKFSREYQNRIFVDLLSAQHARI